MVSCLVLHHWILMFTVPWEHYHIHDYRSQMKTENLPPSPGRQIHQYSFTVHNGVLLFNAQCSSINIPCTVQWHFLSVIFVPSLLYWACLHNGLWWLSILDSHQVQVLPRVRMWHLTSSGLAVPKWDAICTVKEGITKITVRGKWHS